MLFSKLARGLSVGILASICIAIFIVGWNGRNASADQLPQLKVGYIPIADAAQLYVAADLELFRKHGIDIKPVAFAGGAKIIQALSVGELDIGFTGTVPLIQASSRGLDIRAITGGSVQSVKNPYQALAVPEKSDITRPEHLAGATIGVNVLKSIDHGFTLAWLEKHGVDTRSIKFVEIPFPQMEVALSSGQIQAASIIEPYMTLAENRHNARVLAHHIVDVKPDFEMTTYVVTSDKLKERRKEFKAFQLAINEATDLINNGNANLAKSVSGHTNLDEATVGQTTMPGFGSSLSKVNLEFVSDMLIKLGFIETPPDIEKLIVTFD